MFAVGQSRLDCHGVSSQQAKGEEFKGGFLVGLGANTVRCRGVPGTLSEAPLLLSLACQAGWSQAVAKVFRPSLGGHLGPTR